MFISPLLQTDICTYIHTHTYIDTHTQAHAQHTHTSAHTNIRMRTHTHTCFTDVQETIHMQGSKQPAPLKTNQYILKSDQYNSYINH